MLCAFGATAAPPKLRYSTQGSRTIVQVPGKPAKLSLERDATVAPGAAVSSWKVVGALGNDVVLVTDTYASKPGAMSYCQAGEEQFLRVIALKTRLRETFRTKVQSCRSDLELASPGIEWQPDKGALTIRWLSGSKTYAITPAGVVTLKH